MRQKFEIVIMMRERSCIEILQEKSFISLVTIFIAKQAQQEVCSLSTLFS